MATEKRYTPKILKFFQQFFSVIIILAVVVALLGIFIFTLYRVAMFSTTLYTFIFLLVLCGFIVFFSIKSIRKKTFSTTILKFLKFLVITIFTGAIIALIMLYAAFVLRFTLIGIIITPFLIVAFILLFSKFNIFAYVKNIFRDI
jgi:hypothetical protein